MLSQIGLLIIILAWLIQLFVSKKNEILGLFALTYFIGIIFLVIDGFLAGLNSLAWLNIISGLLALLVMFKISDMYRKKKK